MERLGEWAGYVDLGVVREKVTRGVEVKRVRSLGRGMKGWVGVGGVGSMTQFSAILVGWWLWPWMSLVV